MLQILAESITHSANANVPFPLLQLQHDVTIHAQVMDTANLPSLKDCLSRLSAITGNLLNDPSAQPSSRGSHTAKDSTSSASGSGAGKTITCSNCKSGTHPLVNCWCRNGPMFGQQDVVLACRAAAANATSSSMATMTTTSTQKMVKSNMAAPVIPDRKSVV